MEGDSLGFSSLGGKNVVSMVSTFKSFWIFHVYYEDMIKRRPGLEEEVGLGCQVHGPLPGRCRDGFRGGALEEGVEGMLYGGGSVCGATGSGTGSEAGIRPSSLSVTLSPAGAVGGPSMTCYQETSTRLALPGDLGKLLFSLALVSLSGT